MALSTSQKWLAWIGTGTAGILAVGGTYFMAQPKQPSPDKAASTIKPSIEITTTNATPLTFQFGTATVDICALNKQGTWIEKDLLTPDWISQSKQLGFSRTVCYAHGSITGVSHVVLPPLLGHGYNGRVSDFGGSQKDFNEWGNGILKASFTDDFWTKTLAYSNAIGLPMDITLNMDDTWAENKWRIDHSTGEYIFMDAEVVTQTSWQNYLKWCKATRDSITKYYAAKNYKLIADEPVIYKNNQKSQDFRANINPTALTGIYGANTYWQLNDQLFYNTNQDSNVIKSKLFFDSIVPAQIAYFKILFPNWKIVIGQCQLADNRDDPQSVIAQPVNKNIVGVYTWGRMVQMFIENQDIQPYVVQESLKSLNDDSDNNYQVIKLLNKLLKGSNNVVGVTFNNMTGCTGAALQNPTTPSIYTLLINNSSKFTYDLPKITIDGTKKTPSSYILQRMYSSDGTWTTTVVTRDSISSATINIPPASVSVVQFNTLPTAQAGIK